MYGGQESPSPSNITKRSNLENITTEVSVDNFKPSKVDNLKKFNGYSHRNIYR